MPIETMIAGLLAAGLGAGLARTSAPLACVWRGPAASLTRRVRQLARPAPTRLRRTLGGAFLALLLASGGLAAYAAAPDDLPKEAVGVVGSGDQLSLQVKAPDASAPRTVKVGEEYKDGWALKAVTPTTATLAKDGAVKEVGLNPSGVVAPPPATEKPTQVTLAGIPDPATIDRLYQMSVDRNGTDAASLYLKGLGGGGLTLEETKRWIAYNMMLTVEYDRRAGGRFVPGVSPPIGRVLPQDVMGAAGWADYQALSDKQDAFMAARAAVRAAGGTTPAWAPS